MEKTYRVDELAQAIQAFYGEDPVKKTYTLGDLVKIIQALRGENGCPWDKVQTHESLRQDMLEEACEAIDAINKNDMDNLCEELGDVLMQVVFHAEIAAEKGGFTLEDVIRGICEKMIYRHPHVFGTGDVKVDTPEQVLVNWEKLKKKEKKADTQTEIMRNIPEVLPATLRARKVQKKAADVGFDFPVTADAFQKVYEEVRELEEAAKLKNGAEEEEFGDILFAMMNISRFLKINPEFALTKATKKFINRFEYVESTAISEGKHLSEMTLEEMDKLWNEAKIRLCDKE